MSSISRAQNHLSISSVEFKPIGIFNSCWLEKYGTPRQGIFAKKSKGIITLSCCPSSTGKTLEGLEDFSHLTVLFLFHDNRDARSVYVNDGESFKLSYLSDPSPKVRPPRLKSGTKGIFATRTPHRPCPIGMTICKIEKIDTKKGLIEVSGIDLINNTPILDIKPYIPLYDSVEFAKVPSWIVDNNESDKDIKVLITDEAKDSLFSLSNKLKLFKGDPESALSCIMETMKEDIRSSHEKSMISGTFGFSFDVLNVVFEFNSIINTFKIVRIEHWPSNYDGSSRKKRHH